MSINNTARKAVKMLCYLLIANRKMTIALNSFKGNVSILMIASQSLLVTFMDEIQKTCLLKVILHPIQVNVPSCFFLMVPLITKILHQFLGLKEAFEVFHLPNAGDDKDERLGDRPPENTLIGALTRHAKPLLSILKKTQYTMKCTDSSCIWQNHFKRNFFYSPSGSFAPSGSVQLGLVAVGLGVAAQWVCPWLQSQGNC